MKYRTKLAGVVALLLTCVGSSHAALTVHLGENQNPGQMVTGAPLTARNTFLSQLNGVGTETFEAQPVGATSPLNLSFPGSGSPIGATLTGDGVVFQSPSSAGRFNTTGATAAPTEGQWWTVEGSFTLDFNKPISAFGFYGTDVGDFNGRLLITLTDVNDMTTELEVGHTMNGTDGSLVFWGFVDTTKAYKSIGFGNTAEGVDFFGFDDMVVADAGQIRPPAVPEPASLALLGVALAAAGLSRRRARRND